LKQGKRLKSDKKNENGNGKHEVEEEKKDV